MTHLVIILYLPTTAAALGAAVTLSMREHERAAAVVLYSATALSTLWFVSDYLLNNRPGVPEWLPPAIRSAAMVPFVIATVSVTAVLGSAVGRTRARNFVRSASWFLAAPTAGLFVVSKLASGQVFGRANEDTDVVRGEPHRLPALLFRVLLLGRAADRPLSANHSAGALPR